MKNYAISISINDYKKILLQCFFKLNYSWHTVIVERFKE